MNTKTIAIILAILLTGAVAAIVYLYTSNPIKGYHLVYSQDNFKLFAKDTSASTLNKGQVLNGGGRVKYTDGVKMIKDFRADIKTQDDSLKMTRFIDFNFANVFSYMTYLIGKYPDLASSKDLGFRVYIGKNLNETPDPRGGRRRFHTILFAPITDRTPFKFVYSKDFEFFNQGSICPVQCPEDDGKLFMDF